MNTIFTPMILMAAALTLAGCEKSTADAQADAVRDSTSATATNMENKADSVEKTGEVAGQVTENKAEANADAIRDQADAVKDAGETKADAIEAGTAGATTTTDTMTTTTAPTKR